jgi:hypothetical protein
MYKCKITFKFDSGIDIVIRLLFNEELPDHIVKEVAKDRLSDLGFPLYDIGGFDMEIEYAYNWR